MLMDCSISCRSSGLHTSVSVYILLKRVSPDCSARARTRTHLRFMNPAQTALRMHEGNPVVRSRMTGNWSKYAHEVPLLTVTLTVRIVQ